MVALTEQLALSRARADSMADVRSLNLWGNGLTEVWTQKDGLNAYEWHYCITREELHYEMPMHSSIAVVLEKRKSAHPSHTNAVVFTNCARRGGNGLRLSLTGIHFVAGYKRGDSLA